LAGTPVVRDRQLAERAQRVSYSTTNTAEPQPIWSCTFAGVSRTAAAAALVFGLVAATTGLVRPTFAALQVVAVSPAQVEVGQTVEVLVRTFAPFAQGDLGLPMPSQSYPVPSGYWNVLYPSPSIRPTWWPRVTEASAFQFVSP